MDQEIKRKWIEALRSGAYKQGRQYLRLHDKFCCLGVLCDITGVGSWEEDNHAIGSFAITNETGSREFSIIPPSMRDALGLSKAEHYALWQMNDGFGGYHPHSFTEIADHIEANL